MSYMLLHAVYADVVDRKYLRATGWDESSSRGRVGDTTTLRNAKFQLASH